MTVLVGISIGLAFLIGHRLGRRSGHAKGVSDSGTMWPAMEAGHATTAAIEAELARKAS